MALFDFRFEDDKDIERFKSDHWLLYILVERLIDGRHVDREGFNEHFFNVIQKIVRGDLDDEDVRRFKKNNFELYVPIRKLVERKIALLTKAKSRIKPYKKGDFIGQKYEVYDVLGEGGFGIVYLVYSHEIESVYALKTFRDEYLEDLQTRERFEKEAQIWINLERHPYLVRAYFVDKIIERLFIATEYVAPDKEGLNSLEGYLRYRPPDLAQSLRWGIQFCHGMECAYSKGLRAHRDIKPANIMIGQDKTVKISDFGLAGVISISKAMSGIKLDIQHDRVGLSCQTIEGTGFGTPPYMPPEQFTNAASCDERSDIYSLGIVLYQMATGGKLPFLANLPKGGSEEESMHFWREMYMLHSQASIPKLNSPIFPIIQRCLEKELRRRYQTFKELRLDLEIILKQLTGEVIKVPERKEIEAWEWFNKGFSLDKLGKPMEAIACYDKAIEINPMDEGAWLSKGNILNNLGKHQEAIAYYDKAIEINPMDDTAWLNKGSTLDNLGKHQEAIAYYDKAIEINPMYDTAWRNKGFTLNNLGKHQEAIDCFDRALGINPKDANVWCLRGSALKYLGQYHEAIACYDKAIEINPDELKSWFYKGFALYDLGRYQEAIACYDKALEISPLYADVWLGKGKALYSLGQHQEAIVCFDRALRVDSKDVQAQASYHKGLVLKDLGQYRTAIVYFNQALKINPEDAQVWYHKGNSLKALGRYKEAIDAFKNSIKFTPTEHAEHIEKIKEIINELEFQ